MARGSMVRSVAAGSTWTRRYSSMRALRSSVQVMAQSTMDTSVPVPAAGAGAASIVVGAGPATGSAASSIGIAAASAGLGAASGSSAVRSTGQEHGTAATSAGKQRIIAVVVADLPRYFQNGRRAGGGALVPEGIDRSSAASAASLPAWSGVPMAV